MSLSKMQWKTAFYQQLIGTEFEPWLASLPTQLQAWQTHKLHGEFGKWQQLLKQLPTITPSNIDLQTQVSIGNINDATPNQRRHLEGVMKQFMPWRKGPFNIFDMYIDTEWRSDWKWDRLLPYIKPLKNKSVLDVGCGSGYHLWRMAGENARFVVGIDPTQLFFTQFHAIKHFIPHYNVHFIPLGIEDMPSNNAFDTVFSMGVLYHRKDPILFLQQLKNQLKTGGELVLETLVIEGDEQTVLTAGERYAKMRNVWFLPSVDALCVWLKRLGFKNITIADECVTTFQEQRATEWMQNESLQDFLDPANSNITIEGYPAPRRAVIIAEK